MQSSLCVYFSPTSFPGTSFAEKKKKMDQVAEFLTPLLRRIPPSRRLPSRTRKVEQRRFHCSGPSTLTRPQPRLFPLPERSLLLGPPGFAGATERPGLLLLCS